MLFPLLGRAYKFNIFSGEGAQKGEVSIDQWIFEVKSVLPDHPEATLWESIIHSLCAAATDLAPVLHMINKLELTYGIVASFDILMQSFYRLQEAKTERVPVYITHLEGTLRAIWEDHLHMMSVVEIQSLLCDHLFNSLWKPLCDLLCYLYDDPQETYPQIVTAPIKAE